MLVTESMKASCVRAAPGALKWWNLTDQEERSPHHIVKNNDMGPDRSDFGISATSDVLITATKDSNTCFYNNMFVRIETHMWSTCWK